MKKTKRELERMTGVDPYEDEIEDGVPGCLYVILLGILLIIA